MDIFEIPNILNSDPFWTITIHLFELKDLLSLRLSHPYYFYNEYIIKILLQLLLFFYNQKISSLLLDQTENFINLLIETRSFVKIPDKNKNNLIIYVIEPKKFNQWIKKIKKNNINIIIHYLQKYNRIGETIEDYLWKEYCFNKRDNTIHIITILETYTKISAQLPLIKIISSNDQPNFSPQYTYMGINYKKLKKLNDLL